MCISVCFVFFFVCLFVCVFCCLVRIVAVIGGVSEGHFGVLWWRFLVIVGGLGVILSTCGVPGRQEFRL